MWQEWIALSAFLSLSYILLAWYCLHLRKTQFDLILENKKILSQKKSSEVITGQIAETLAPFLSDFKYNPQNAIFLGQPIDYLVFEKNEIVFVEIKSGNSTLSKKQRNIRDLIKNNKISWKEIRIK
jgi:predicted Holliday junction resolvase-like endonuclease